MAKYTLDLCTGGTASSNGHYLSYAPGAAFDNNIDSFYHRVGFPSQLQYELVEPRIIKKYTIRGRAGVPSQSPYIFTFEGSNNAVAWDILDTQVAFNPWSTNLFQEFIISNNTSYLYYRLNITRAVGAGDNGSVAEFEMMEMLDPIPTSTIYNTSSVKKNIRGKAAEGFIRPTITEFFTSKDFEETLK